MLCIYIYIYVCVCEREREREGQRKKKSKIKFVLLYHGSMGQSKYPPGLSKLARLSHGLVSKRGQRVEAHLVFGSTLEL